MELIARAPWREAVTYRETWPHEYVVVKRDGQQELLDAFCERISRGEGVECQFFHQRRNYLFLSDYKYWIMVECLDIDLDTEDEVVNRARLYRDRRDFVIQRGDTGKREDCLASPAYSRLGSTSGVLARAMVGVRGDRAGLPQSGALCLRTGVQAVSGSLVTTSDGVPLTVEGGGSGESPC